MVTEKNSRKSYAMMIASLVIVSTIGIFRRYIPLSSALLAFFRGAIGALSLLGICLLIKGRGREKIPPRKLLALILSGAFIGVNWMLLFEAYNYTSIARATLCYYLQPTIVLLLSPLVFKEALGLRKLLCALAALGGMVLVSGVLGSGGTGPGELRGIRCALGAALFYALVVIMNKKTGQVDIYQKTIIQLAGAAAAMLPYLLLTELPLDLSLSAGELALLLIVGVVHTGLCYVLYFGSMDGLRAQTISILGYIDPVLALILSALILSEPMSPSAIAGAVLILGSSLISELEPKGR